MAKLIAVRGNREYTIDEKERRLYKAQGFDIREVADDGTSKILEHGDGKTVPYTKYQSVLDELAAVKAELAAMQDSKPSGKLKDAQERIKALEDELAAVKTAAPQEG